MSIENLDVSVFRRELPTNDVYRKDGFKTLFVSGLLDNVFNFEFHVPTGDLKKSALRGKTKWNWAVPVVTYFFWRRTSKVHIYYGLAPKRFVRILAHPEAADWWSTVYLADSGDTGTTEHPPIPRAEINNIARAVANKAAPAGVLVDYLRESLPIIETWMSAPAHYLTSETPRAGSS